MSVEHFFTHALGLGTPWQVVSSVFDPAAKSLKLDSDFLRGSRFPDPAIGELCPVHDTIRRTWEHLRFFEHKTTISACVPRIKTAAGAVVDFAIAVGAHDAFVSEDPEETADALGTGSEGSPKIFKTGTESEHHFDESRLGVFRLTRVLPFRLVSAWLRLP